MFHLVRHTTRRNVRVVHKGYPLVLAARRQYSKMLEQQKNMVFNVMTPTEIRNELKQRNHLARGLIQDLRTSLMEAIEVEHEDMSNDPQPKKLSNNEGIDYELEARKIRAKFDAFVTSKMIVWKPTDPSSELQALFKDIQNPRPHDSWISDNAKLFSEAEILVIDSFAQSMFDNIGVEVAVVTVPKLPPQIKTGEELATFICQHWQVGYYSTGKGFVVVVDASMRCISVVPAFFTDEFNAEVNQSKPDGIDWAHVVSHTLRICEDQLEGIHKAEKPAASRIPMKALYLMKRRRDVTRCSKCGAIVKIGGIDGNDLNSGEAIERHLGSVNHFAKMCTNPECNHTETLRVPQTKRYVACHNCGFHTKPKSEPSAPCPHCGFTTATLTSVTE